MERFQVEGLQEKKVEGTMKKVFSLGITSRPGP
jgi:hypothetical protein